MNNVVFIDFYNKKNYPIGKWSSEPDLCRWNYKELPCLVVRDMSIGTWKGFVGLSPTHPFFGLKLEEVLNIHSAIEIFLSVYGGISSSGALPPRYQEDAGDFWWLGLDTSYGGDLLPFLDKEPHLVGLISNRTYKDFNFIRKETNKLAKLILEVT